MKCNIEECNAACCGPVPMKRSTIEKHQDKINKGAKIKIVNNQYVVINLKTLRCGFIDPDNRCKIYEDRPIICRKFGDGKQVHPMLKCQYLGQIGTWEQEAAMDCILKGTE